MKSDEIRCILAIAGTDPTGGAGIQADMKSISATGGYCASVITALVAQNTQGVQSVLSIDPLFVKKQLISVLDDLTISAVKIGMLDDENIISVVFDTLRAAHIKQVVLDPVMVAKCGTPLLNPSVVASLKDKAAGVITLLTPNLYEARYLAGCSIESKEDMEKAAVYLAEEFQCSVLLKGGHLEGILSEDVLYDPASGTYAWFSQKRINTQNTHGTGCTLSSAIASYLGQGYPLTLAIETAKEYLTKAIERGASLSIGKGCGPVDHFFNIR